MFNLDQLFVRRPRAVHIEPFTVNKADEVIRDSAGHPIIFYIKTREGRRLINPGMMIATKTDDYRHPMDADVFNRDYVALLGYESALVEEFKRQIAAQLSTALASEAPIAAITNLVAMIEPPKSLEVTE